MFERQRRTKILATLGPRTGPMSAPIYLNDLGVVCALGDGRAAVASAMFADVPGGLSDNDSLLPRAH